ncbi:MAG: hypothetical protein KF681_09970 [Bdellovibrionaceae bacterium]|nr:hypothetical protein [Pseudobdellovibrionaceae bacterium]
MNQPVVQAPSNGRRVVIFAVLLSLVFGAYSPGLHAQRRGIVKGDLVASEGSCLPNMSEAQARSVLAENGITYPGGKSEEIIALGKAVQQINAMSGDRTSQIRGTRVEFNNRRSVSRQKSTTPPVIEICRNGHPHLGNVGLMAHELGHLIGNKNNARLYSQYKSRVRPRCCLTNYACSNSNSQPRNEEFAEVFASFIANPSLAANAGGSCPAALNFFKSEFKNGQQAGCGNSPTILTNSSSQDVPVTNHTDAPQADPVQTAISRTTPAPAPNFNPSPWAAMIGPLAAFALPMLLAKTQSSATPAPVPVATPVQPVVTPIAPAGSQIPTGTR